VIIHDVPDEVSNAIDANARCVGLSPSPSDLLIAATAELSQLTILHVDKDSELIAGVTGQPVERLAVV
jgi:predicted nucleic acid-binding protein